MKYLFNELSAFPKQIEYAHSKYHPHGLKIHEIDRIVICGLGGSGIAGKIVKALFAHRLTIPVEVVSTYDLPAFASGDTLVIVSSYSGNTEETLSMYSQARAKEVRILTITTGGELLENAKKDKILNYSPEKGYQPRMALGYSLSYMIMMFEELLNDEDAYKEWKNLSEYFKATDEFVSKAKTYFDQIKVIQDMKRFIIVADETSLPAGIRFCQQIQENAKTEAFICELPEACHNVIETFYGSSDAVYIFLNSKMNRRMDLRFDFFQQLLSKHNNKAVEITFSNKLYKNIYENIYILDWISLLIADQKNINSSKIENINNLKSFLSEN